jgi:cellulose synthase/poly-beta-1,6-N-acetylglucosamine synthase-like glycosyltransferase
VPGGKPAGLSYSVVIAARNEERQIGTCLAAVLDQSIAAERFEVIVVNDRSTDRTAEVVGEYAQRDPRVKLVTVDSCPAGVSPKKHALACGIRSAKNEVIACTDADCWVPRTWLETLDRHFDPKTGLVQGISLYRRRVSRASFLHVFQSLDFLSHGVVAAAAIGGGVPLNANGNNIAYRREVFDAVGGFGEGGRVLLGDDDLLLQRVWRDRRWRVRYALDPHGAVETAPAHSWREMLTQRARWGSVAVHYGPRQMLLLLGFFLFFCAIPVALVGWLWYAPAGAVGVSMLCVKLLGEYAAMIPGAHRFGRSGLLVYLPLVSPLHLLMVLYATFAGAFGRHEWKGQVSGSAVS